MAPNDSTTDVPEMFYVAATLGTKPWLAGENVLVSAGTAFRNPNTGSSLHQISDDDGDDRAFSLSIPDADQLFVDSGGFQATVHFDNGVYPYTAEELFEWAESIDADYVSGMDWACETAEELAEEADVEAADIAPIPERIERTVGKQVEQYEVYRAGEWDFEFVPVIQGYTAEDYRYCARRLREAGLAQPYMSIGSVCKRDSVDDILRVLRACRDELPSTQFHLFGATLNLWKDRRAWTDAFRSGDTHAWALNTRDGDLPSDKAETAEAFEVYREKVEAIQRRIADLDTLDDCVGLRSDGGQQRELPSPTDPYECVCGTTVPAYPDPEFEPGCRNCEMSALNRMDHSVALLDDASTPTDPTPSTQGSLDAFGD